MQRIQAHGRDWVFTAADFLDLGRRDAVDQALHRLSDGLTPDIRRVGWGLYDYPRRDLDGTAPDPAAEAIVRAIQRRDGHRMERSGAHHAHEFGLADPPPWKIWLTDGSHRYFKHLGPDRVRRVSEPFLELRHAPRRTMVWAGRPGAPIVLAMMWMGKDRAGEVAQHLRKSEHVTQAARDDVARHLRHAPGWMRDYLIVISGERQSRRRKRVPHTDSGPAQLAGRSFG